MVTAFSYSATVQSFQGATTLNGLEYLGIDQQVASSATGYGTRRVTINTLVNNMRLNEIATVNSAASNTATVLDNIIVNGNVGSRYLLKVKISGSSTSEYTYSEYIVNKKNAVDGVLFKLLFAVNTDEAKLIEPSLTYDSTDNQVDITMQAVGSNDGSTDWRIKIDQLVGGVDSEPRF